MPVKQIWMSPDTQKKSRYGLRTLGGILGITVLTLALVIGGTVLGLSMGWSIKHFSLLLCIGVTALAVTFAAGLGRRSVGDATVFFLTEEDRLFAVDIRHLIPCGRSLASHMESIMKTQDFLRKLAQSHRLPAGADEILRVEQSKENSSHYALVCQVRHPNGRVLRRTYFLVKGMEDQELLLRQLERREGWSGSPEVKENRNPFCILLSTLVCCGFASLCVLSHPAVAQLPQALYFPCLGAAFAALCCMVWFGIRQHRGE